MSMIRNDLSATVGLYARGLGSAEAALAGASRASGSQAFADFSAFLSGGERFGLGRGASAPVDAGLAARAAVAFIAES